MKQRKRAILRRLFIWLMALSLLISTSIGTAVAAPSAGGERLPETGEEGTLTPPDYSYEEGNVILHKQAERIGPDEWKVNVKVTIGAKPVEKRKMEVVMLMDLSSSMRTNEVEDHKHTDACSELTCTVHTEHTDDCYELTCTLQEHTHTDACCSIPEHEHESYLNNNNRGCYQEKCNDHTSYQEHQAAGCVYNYNGNANQRGWYKISCGYEEHTHSASCNNTCEDNLTYHTHTLDTCYVLNCDLPFVTDHVHGLGCYHCPYYGFKDVANPNQWGNNTNEYILNGYATRMAVAAVAAERLLSSLPADSTTITRLGFNSQSAGVIGNISSYYDVNTNTGTYLWQAINQVLSGDYFSDDPNTKKIFVILNDGNANDSSNTATQNLLNSFKETGTIFTVGFAEADSMLGSIAGGDGGKYMMATNASQLIESFDDLAETLTAMLEDPMGSSVEFEVNNIQEIQTAGGTITPSGDTIYWHPAEDGSGTIVNSTIEYSYTVKLSDQADVSVGEHLDVPLNKTTYFYYGTKTGTETNMKAAEFPIPEAEYAYSSVQTFWQTTNGQNIQTPTEVEKIICDYSSATYIPAFTQDYRNNPPIIPVAGSNDYYRYVGTTVTADGTKLNGVEDVDATQPVAYQVIHQYELVKANELYVGGTKSLIGRDFKAGDSFEFTLTAETANAPMPTGAANGSLTTTITPTSGNAMAFSFGKIEFDEAGTYTYKIQEKQGNLEKMVYDTVERTMVVTVTETNGSLLATYTVDGVANAPINIVNRLEPGTLKVEKAQVNSHLPQHQTQEFGFLISAKNQSNRPLSGNYTLKKSDGTTATVTFTNGYASVKLKAGEYVIIEDLPDGATYTVTEDRAGGFTVTATGDTGTIVAKQESYASFINTYAASFPYQFIGTKLLDGGTLTTGQFSFRITDEEGNVVSTGKNLATGEIFFDTITFTHKDVGEKVYHYVAEDVGADGNYIYDPTVYTVKLTITDNGDGTLKIVADTENKNIVFSNKYLKDVLRVRKTVTGNMGNRYQPFPFTLTVKDGANQTINLSTDGGLTFNEVKLDGNGQTTFELMHGQNIIFYPVTGTFTVTETANGSYTTSYSLNGADAVSGTSVTADQDGGSTVEFVNTLDVGVPTGVSLPNSAALAGIAMAMALLAIVYAGRRWKPLEK